MTNQLEAEIIQPILKQESRLQNYQTFKQTFEWKTATDPLTFRQTGLVNMGYECVDRHVLEGRGDHIALHYIDDTTEIKLTYSELQKEVIRYAQAFKSEGIKIGDRVFVLLPKNVDNVLSILALMRIGAVVGPLFEAFMEEAIIDRVNDCEGIAIITNSEMVSRVNVGRIPTLETVFVTDGQVDLPKHIYLKELIQEDESHDPIEFMDLEDGVVLHYTSGSTGKPKGVLHAHRMMIQLYHTGQWVLDLHPDDVYWCTSHPGWVTGHLYGILSPLLNGVTVVLNGGRFNAEAWLSILEKTKVTVWYSAPTAFRMLKNANPKIDPKRFPSLRHLLSVGEPLNPDIFYWALEVFGLRIHDNWWMTETGGQLVANLPSEPIKPGSMGRPLPGIEIKILNEAGEEVGPHLTGYLAVKAPWPSIMKEIWKNPSKFEDYFRFEGYYLSGDLASIDQDGYVFYQGRGDDMINSAGERIGPFEVESQLLKHPAVKEAAVIGKLDPLRGEIVKAFLVLNPAYSPSDSLLEEIRLFVRKNLAAHAAPRELEVIDALPKTQISGKIMRRILRQRELDELNESERIK